MSDRRPLLGLLGAAVLAVAACAGTGPSGGSVSLPSIVIPSGAIPSVALEGFCAEFTSELEAKWPNIDASTAARLAPIVQQWAAKPEMASVQADVTVIATWMTQAATSTSVTTPPAEVTAAFDRVKAFADANC